MVEKGSLFRGLRFTVSRDASALVLGALRDNPDYDSKRDCARGKIESDK